MTLLHTFDIDGSVQEIHRFSNQFTVWYQMWNPVTRTGVDMNQQEYNELLASQEAVTLHQQWLATKTTLSFFEQLESDRLDHEEYVLRNELPGFENIRSAVDAQSDYPWDGTTGYSDDIPF